MENQYSKGVCAMTNWKVYKTNRKIYFGLHYWDYQVFYEKEMDILKDIEFWRKYKVPRDCVVQDQDLYFRELTYG